MDRLIQTGRITVLAILAVLLLLSAYGLLTDFSLTSLARFSLTLVLFVNLWQGRAWARWLTVILAALGGIGLLLSVISAVSSVTGIENLVMVVATMAFIYLASAALLAFSPAVRVFLDYQDENRA